MVRGLLQAPRMTLGVSPTLAGPVCDSPGHVCTQIFGNVRRSFLVPQTPVYTGDPQRAHHTAENKGYEGKDEGLPKDRNLKLQLTH